MAGLCVTLCLLSTSILFFCKKSLLQPQLASDMGMAAMSKEAYGCCSVLSSEIGWALFYVRPKVHMFCHLLLLSCSASLLLFLSGSSLCPNVSVHSQVGIGIHLVPSVSSVCAEPCESRALLTVVESGGVWVATCCYSVQCSVTQAQLAGLTRIIFVGSVGFTADLTA